MHWGLITWIEGCPTTHVTHYKQPPVENAKLKISFRRDSQALKDSEPDNTIEHWKRRYRWIHPENKSFQKIFQLQVLWVWSYTTHCQPLSKSSIEERDTLRGVPRPGLRLVVKNTKEALCNRGIFVMKIDIAKKSQKKKKKTLYNVKSRGPQTPSPNVT